MRSILLCEGPDDLWFSGYYLHKVAQWMPCKGAEATKRWRNYKIPLQNERQQVQYFYNKADNVAIWCVAGKDCFDIAISTIINKLIVDYPSDPVNSIVILRDRDEDDEATILNHFSEQFDGLGNLANKCASIYSREIDGTDVSIKVTPVIIPFEDCGAIESVLMESVRDANSEGKIIVEEACKYIDRLKEEYNIGNSYLKHNRDIVKAKYSATIAATNPSHSTALFMDLALACPWETSPCVKKHFDVIVGAVSSL